ncbi:MAG: sulfatase [Bacteroides sp.]|nr:sulfatase [Bacteroides sp.]
MSAAIVPALADEEEKDKPNIVIIYCDDLGYGDIGITGHPDIKTPNLDKMAMEGIRFTNYYSASPASTASRYALLTGRYPPRSGFGWVLNPDSEKGIHPQELTLAELLKGQGYKTAMYGKWHLGNTRREYLPLQNGFDEWIGLPYSNDMIPPRFQDIALMCGNDTLEINPDQSILTELYTQKTISFMRKNKDTPFFIYLPYAMPHVPLFPGKAFQGKSKRGIYGDTVEEIDWGVGEILKELELLGIAQNTIVWFMSDNGPWLLKNEEGGSAGLFRDGKGSTWEGGVRVPCFAYWPGRLVSSVSEEVITSMDVFATSVWMGGAEIPTDRVIDGKNAASYLAYKQVSNKEEIPFYYFGLNHQLMAVRKGPWKLHVKTYSQLNIDYFEGKLPLLFNLYEDPSEKYDLALTHLEIVKELISLIEYKKKEIRETGSFFDN